MGAKIGPHMRFERDRQLVFRWLRQVGKLF